MFKRLLVGGVILGGVAMVVRSKLRRGYDEDEIDRSGEGAWRIHRAPDQTWDPAKTRTNTTPESLATAASIENSLPEILKAWPALTEADVKAAEDDRDRLATLIAEKTGAAKDEARKKLDAIIAEQTPVPSFPAL